MYKHKRGTHLTKQSVNKNGIRQHQHLMGFLMTSMPQVIHGLQGQGNAMTMSTVNNFNQMGLGAGPL